MNRIAALVAVIVVGLVAMADSSLWMKSRSHCPERRYTISTIRPDINARDAAIVALTLAWKTTKWCEQPEWVKHVIIDNSEPLP